MRIEFWLDFLCPITYLTHKNLIAAIKGLGLQKYELYYRSFQINDNGSENFLDVFLKHHTTQDEEVIIEFLETNFPKYKELKYYDTNLAHQLSHLSKHKNLAMQCNEAIFEAYFEKGLDISDVNVLSDIGLKIGLDQEEVNFTLNTKCYTNQIAINKENANNRGIKEIPHVRINMQYNQNGYFTVEDIRNLIISIINRRGSKLEICGEYCDF